MTNKSPDLYNDPLIRDAIDRLRTAGYCVVAWTPEEIGKADPDVLEEIVVSRGNEYLEITNDEDDEE